MVAESSAGYKHNGKPTFFHSDNCFGPNTLKSCHGMDDTYLWRLANWWAKNEICVHCSFCWCFQLFCCHWCCSLHCTRTWYSWQSVYNDWKVHLGGSWTYISKRCEQLKLKFDDLWTRSVNRSCHVVTSLRVEHRNRTLKQKFLLDPENWMIQVGQFWFWAW